MKHGIWIGLAFALALICAGLATAGYVHGGVETAWLWLDRLTMILGLIAVVPLLYAVWMYLSYERQRRQRLERLRTEPGRRPMVLIVTVGADIRSQVESFLKGMPGFDGFDFSSGVVEVTHEKKFIEQTDLDAISRECEKAYQSMVDNGVDKIHLFVHAPTPVGLRLGQILANRTPTVIYHYQRGEGYQNWGLLQKW